MLDWQMIDNMQNYAKAIRKNKGHLQGMKYISGNKAANSCEWTFTLKKQHQYCPKGKTT